MSSISGCMNGSPPRMPKNELPIAFASSISRFIAAGSIRACLAATSTQHPWQRRLQLLMTEIYRNGGKNSPRFSRDLCRWTERMPFRPKFQASFHSSRLSVSSSRRLARRRYMGKRAPSWQQLRQGRTETCRYYSPIARCHRAETDSWSRERPRPTGDRLARTIMLLNVAVEQSALAALIRANSCQGPAMKCMLFSLSLLLLVPLPLVSAADEEGFVSLFNGKDLTGWKGDTNYWSVRDGAL